MTLRVGADRMDITPNWPVDLAGFAARAGDGAATRVLAPLHVRSLALTDDAGTRVAFVSADLLWWGDDTVATVRRAATARLGLESEAIVLHATHNHSGPQTSRRFTALLGEPDAGYIDRLVEAAVGSIGRALQRLVPVRVERTATTSNLGVDRRSARTGGAVAPVRIDREATVVRFTGKEGAVALLVHFACHPVVHHGNAFTSDFAGAAMDVLERDDPGLVALFAQGCCGDVNPSRYAGAEFLPGDQADVEVMGASVASTIQAALAREVTPVGPPRLAITHREIELPTSERLTNDELRTRAQEEALPGQWARLLLNDPVRHAAPVTVQATRLTLAPDLALLGLSAEPVSAYGLHVKKVSGGRVLPLGYTNGMTGYLVTACQLAQGGYEAAEAPFYFGMPAPFSPDVEQVLTKTLTSLASITSSRCG